MDLNMLLYFDSQLLKNQQPGDFLPFGAFPGVPTPAAPALQPTRLPNPPSVPSASTESRRRTKGNKTKL